MLITATNSRDRKPYFLSPKGSGNQWRELLKASSALPFLYKQGVKLTTEYNAVSVSGANRLKLGDLRIFTSELKFT